MASFLDVRDAVPRAVVIDRSDRATEPLKAHLLVLLKDPELPVGLRRGSRNITLTVPVTPVQPPP